VFTGEPGDGARVAVEGGLSDDGVVGPSVEGDEELIAVDGDVAAGFDELAIELFGFHGGAALEALAEPAIAAVGQDGHHDVGVDVEADLAGQAVEVEEVDVDAEVVFDAVAVEVACDDVAARDGLVVGSETSNSRTSATAGVSGVAGGATVSPGISPEANSAFTRSRSARVRLRSPIKPSARSTWSISETLTFIPAFASASAISVSA